MPLQISWYLAHAVDWDVEKSNVPYVLTDVTLTVNGAATNCRIAHILGILLMNSCNTDKFLATTTICSLSTLNGVKKNPCLEKVACTFQLKQTTTTFFKFNNSFLHYQNGSTMTLLFVHLIFLTMQQLLKKESAQTIVSGRLFAKSYHFLENTCFAWKFRQMVLKEVWHFWSDATSRCWNLLLQNAIRWKLCEVWKHPLPICWISSIMLSNVNPTHDELRAA